MHLIIKKGDTVIKNILINKGKLVYML